MQSVGTKYKNPAKNCIPIYDHKFGDLKTDLKELVNAFKMGIFEQAILFTYAGLVSDITIPGIIQNRNPNPKHTLKKRPAKKYLLKLFLKTSYGTSHEMTSLFSKYKAGITINKFVSKATTTL